ncbi:hypothetical protein Tco_0778723 [Tanacetum coccineum]
MTKSKSFDRNPKYRALYHALMESILEDEDAMDKGVAEKLKKRKPDDADRDEDPPAGPDQGLKRRKTHKDVEPSMKNLGEDIGKTDEPPIVKDDPKISDLTKADLVDYFFNNDLAYLQGGSTDRTYTTSLTKMKATKCNFQGIEGMVPTLWSPIKVVYDKHALLVTIVKVNKWYGYGHLEEIEVRRAYQQLYKFMEGDFPRLHLNDIEDMLLLIVQNKLFNFKSDIIVNLSAALHMFTRHPQGVIYEDKLNKKRLMHSDELYKFSDCTLQSVRDTLHDMETNLRMGYNKAMLRRRWSNLDKKRSHIMVKDIDQQLLERRLMRSLEKLVGGREYGEDLRLL